MSAVPTLRRPVTIPQERTTLRAKPGPIVRETPKPYYRVSTQRRSLSFAGVVVWVMAFCMLTGASYVASSILGHVRLQQVRGESQMAIQRALDAKLAVGDLERQIERLSSSASMRQWAQVNGFRPAPFEIKDSREENHVQTVAFQR